jgi:hypothetical protein
MIIRYGIDVEHRLQAENWIKQQPLDWLRRSALGLPDLVNFLSELHALKVDLFLKTQGIGPQETAQVGELVKQLKAAEC